MLMCQAGFEPEIPDPTNVKLCSLQSFVFRSFLGFSKHILASTSCMCVCVCVCVRVRARVCARACVCVHVRARLRAYTL